MNKKPLLFFIVLLLITCIAIFSFSLYAVAEIYPDIEGSGTIEDPYVVYTADGLIELAEKPNFSVAYAELNNDINLSDSAFNGFGSFGGSFNGKGHSIVNLNLNGSGRNMGLFSIITSSASIVDLKIEANINSTSVHPFTYTGILAGTFDGYASGIHTFGTISGNVSVGGVVGSMSGGTLTASSSDATIMGNLAGGLVGYLTDGVLSHSYSIGSIAAISAGGGIAGDLQGGVVEYAFNRSAITKQDPLNDSCYIGHIVGTSLVENFDNNYYFDVIGNEATNIIGAFGDNFDTGDIIDAATLVGDLEAKTTFIKTLNDNQALWAYATQLEDGYPTLRTKYDYAALSEVGATYTYTKDTPQEVTFTSNDYLGDYTSYYEGETFNGVAFSISATAPINAGNYTVYAKPDSATTIGVIILDYTIQKADLTADYLLSDKLDSTYTGYTQTLEILDGDSQVPDWAALGLDEPSYEYFAIIGEEKIPVSNVDAKDVGVYEVIATIEGGNNYNNLTGEAALVATLEITKATLYMQADDKHLTYGDNLPMFTVSVTGFVADEYPSIVRDFVAPTAKYADAEIPVNAGDYLNKIIIETAGSAHNYIFLPLPNEDPEDPSPEGSGSLFIQKANLLGITFASKTVTYNGLPHSVSISGNTPSGTVVVYALDSETPDWQSLIEKTNAGTYRILANVNAGENYNLLALSTDLIIQKADIIGLVFTNITYTYDGTPKTVSLDTEFDHTVTYAKDGITLESAPISAGSYTAYADVEGGGNYKDIRLEATIIINKMFVRVVANNESTIYGEPLLDTFSVSYFDMTGAPIASVPSSLGASANCEPLVNSGSYAITASVVDTNNYDVIINDGLYVVQKAELRVSVEKLKVPYNTEIPAFNLVYTGFVFEENAGVLLSAPIVSTDAIQGDDVGEYFVTLSGGEASNYYFVLQSGYHLIIEKTDRSGIVFNSKSTVFDATEKQIVPETSEEFIVTYNGDTYLPINVGTYTAVLTIAENKNYYSFTATAMLTINKANIFIVSNSPSTTYGEDYVDITLNYSVSNTTMTPELLSIISAEFTCSINAENASTIAAGNYPITINYTANSNLNITAINGTYTVNKALLTFTIISNSYKYNEAIQTPSVTIAGFVGEDTLSSLTTAPALSAIPSKGDSVGVYPVFLSGGVDDNYSFKYVHGNITITKASLVDIYSLNNKSEYYDGLTKTVALEWADGSAEEVTYLPSFVVTGGSVNETNAGVYPVSISIEDTDGNYEFITFSAVLTILPRVLTVQGTSAINRVYNSDNKVTLTGGVLYDGDVPFAEAGVSLQLGVGILDSKDVGEDIMVNTNVSLTGNASRNYTVVQPTVTVIVTPKTLNILGVTAINRYYNGDTKVSLSIPDGTLVGIVGEDIVLPDKDASYGIIDKNVGENKPVTANIMLKGADSHNYLLIQPDNITVDIIAGSIFDTNDVFEDGWVQIIDNSFEGEYSKEESKITYALPVFIYDGSSFTLPLLKNVDIEGVTWTIDGNTAAGAGAHTATITIESPSGNFLSEVITVSWVVSPRIVVLSELTAQDKVYDGENTATLLDYTTDILLSDEVTLDVISAVFAASVVGNHFVTFAFTLAGADAANYTLTEATYLSTSEAEITPRPITITNVIATSRDYNGQTLIELSGGELQNVINNELTFVLNNGQLASADAGENLIVTTNIEVLGDAVQNYIFTQPSLTVTISPKTIVVVANNHTIEAKKDLPSLTYTVEGLVGDDEITGALEVATDGRKKGEYTITLGTLSAGDNYQIDYSAGTLTVKTPAYVWAIVGVSSGLGAGGAGFGIYLFIKKRKKVPASEGSREIKD